jgi:acyl CoA:acetate/3-ketoacid CoA transferase alpha subunit
LNSRLLLRLQVHAAEQVAEAIYSYCSDSVLRRVPLSRIAIDGHRHGLAAQHIRVSGPGLPGPTFREMRGVRLASEAKVPAFVYGYQTEQRSCQIRTFTAFDRVKLN